MAYNRLTITTSGTVAQDQDDLKLSLKEEAAPRLARYFRGVGQGASKNTIVLESIVGGVTASGMLKLTGQPSNNETFSVANVTFTAKTSGATGNEFNIGTHPGGTVVNAMVAINNSSDLTSIVTAYTTVSGHLAIQCVVPGTLGNAIQLSESMSNTTAVQFTGGTNGTRSSHLIGG